MGARGERRLQYRELTGESPREANASMCFLEMAWREVVARRFLFGGDI